MDSSIIAALGAMIGTCVVISITWYVVLVIANWKIFTKAGEPGWKSIIPIYNAYIVYKIAWKTSWFWIGIILGAVVGLCSVFATSDAAAVAMIANIISIILTIASIVITVVAQHKLSKSFGHGVGYTLGLIFLNPIFTLILGFGSSQYQGADL